MVKNQMYKRNIDCPLCEKSWQKKKNIFQGNLINLNRSSNCSSQWKSNSYIFVRGSKVYEIIMEYYIKYLEYIYTWILDKTSKSLARSICRPGDKRANEMLI